MASLRPRAAQNTRTDWPEAFQAQMVSRQNCSRLRLRRRVFGTGGASSMVSEPPVYPSPQDAPPPDAYEKLEDLNLLSFLPAVNFGVATRPVSVVTADFTGDSKLDLVTANQFGNNVSVLLGNGDGTFQQAVSYAA
ncbi:MAG TPA: VCBS repeat-containing protein, partial [Gemmataceae bacterium]|nr:VCBS repeat-containing protein [Gemmataceae bacterium]